MAASVTPVGRRVPAQALEVVSTPRRKAMVTIAITEDILNWLVKAVKADWPGCRSRKRPISDVDFSEMPELDPSLHYRRDSAGYLQIAGHCKDKSGAVRKRCWLVRPLTKATNGECSEETIRACERLVLAALEGGGESTAA